jgi:hypothetical protein
LSDEATTLPFASMTDRAERGLGALREPDPVDASAVRTVLRPKAPRDRGTHSRMRGRERRERRESSAARSVSVSSVAEGGTVERGTGRQVETST